MTTGHGIPDGKPWKFEAGVDTLMVERQITTCTMPHGARMAPSETHLYTDCMMDDQLVETDTRSLEVSRRFGVADGREGALAAPDDAGAGMGSMAWP